MRPKQNSASKGKIRVDRIQSLKDGMHIKERMRLVMDMDAGKVQKIIGQSGRFLSPFSEPCGYYVWMWEEEETVEEKIVELYWEKLEYAVENAEELIRQAVWAAYENAELKTRISSPFETVRQKLIFESFVLNPAKEEIGACLSNADFMAGHYIECQWNSNWELIFVHYC